jgi:serine/threonine protein kinase/Tol biopolymer transport system component
MTPARWQRIKRVFHEAAEREPGRRAAYLDGECADDPDVRMHVESLLVRDACGPGLLNSEFDAADWLGQERVRLLQDVVAESARQDGAEMVESAERPSRDVPRVAVSSRATAVRLRPGEVVGPYRVLELLGAGGMGEVYKAADTRLERLVALKLLSTATLDQSRIRRFIREARAASALNHPNICTVHDIGEYQDEPYLVMELLDGQSLDALIAKEPPAIDRFLDLGRQIARGLQAAHAAGIVHRDIKPANIFVTSEGLAKILDFGVATTRAARADDESGDSEQAGPTELLTRPGSIAGTPRYMSPEQARGLELDARSDLFSLGVVLLEMATGKAPFSGQQSLEPLNGWRVDRSAMRKQHRGLPRAVRRVLCKALAHSAGDRHQTAGELLNDLDRIVRVRARRPFHAAAALLGMAGVAAASLLPSRESRAPSLGREWVQITNFSDSVTEPALSANGQLLTFIRGPRTFATLGQVYVMRLPDGEPRALTDDTRVKMSPVFSPSDLDIAYTSIDDTWAYDTWRVPLSGGTARPLLENASGLSWIAGGALLFSEIRTGIHMSIVTSDERGRGRRSVYIPPRDTGMAHRAYLSPDRRSVLVAEMETSRWLPCRLVPFDGSSRGRDVGPPGASCTSAAWSPDGRWMYFSANAGGAFHIWRQAFPEGVPEQITAGPAEEEGIAIAPDGRSLITSVGTGTSTIWIRDPRGERPLSEQGHSFLPTFSRDGRTVYYLASQRPGAFQANRGELWSVDAGSGVRRRLALSDAIVRYSVDAKRNEVFFVTVGEKPNATLWRAPLDGRSAPEKVAEDVGRTIAVTDEGILFLAFEGPNTHVFVMRPDGTPRRKALPEPVTGLRAVSPDGRWLVVNDRTPLGKELSPVVLYPLGGSVTSRIPLCSSCFVDWVPDGRYVSVRFSGASDAEQRSTYLVPLPSGELLPPLFRQGRFIDEADVAATPGVRVVEGAVSFGADLNTYVYPKLVSHRNLFRIPLQ